MKDVKEGYPEQWLGGMSKGEGVAAEIRLLIVSGEIEVDTLLTENQVAKQFDVSRSPVRDAFKLLQTDRLIRIRTWVLKYYNLVIEKKNSMIYV